MIQDIYQVRTALQGPAYPIGFKYPISDPLDLRAFHYARAGNTLCTDFGAKQARWQDIAFATINAPVAVGLKTIPINVGALDGFTQNGIFAADELAGGYLLIYTHLLAPAAGHTFTRMITHNTATTGAGVMVVTVDRPLPFPLTIAAPIMHVEAIANPFKNVQYLPADSPYMSVVGIPTMPAAVGEYVWLQTWGPIWVNAQLQVSTNPNNRQVVFGPAGDVYEVDVAVPGTVGRQQHAGFVIANGNTGPRPQGAPFIFLQITP